MDATSHQTNEALRKSLHILFGLFAFTLKWLPWWMAAIVAACAVLGNWLLLHRIFGRGVSRSEKGYDAGIVIYPVMVLLLIIVFRDALHYAAIAWVLLAFGDGFASLAGQRVRLGQLPWNRRKGWSGLLAFFIAGGASGRVSCCLRPSLRRSPNLSISASTTTSSFRSPRL